MSGKTNLILITSLVLLVAILYINRGVDRQQDVSDSLLLSELNQDDVNVERVVITAAGNQTIATLEQMDGRWVLRERSDYPANTAKLGALLRTLAESSVLEKKTADIEFHDRLGVEDLASEDAAGIGVALAGAGIDRSVILGEPSGSYRYARHADDAQAWLIDRNPDVPAETTDWLLPELLDIEGRFVQSVTIVHPDGETVQISKADSAASDYDVLNMPAGRELRYAGIVNAIGSALSNLTLDDVMPSSVAIGDTTITEYHTFSGVQVHVESFEHDGETWFRFQLVQDVVSTGEDMVDAGEYDESEKSDIAAAEPTATVNELEIDVDAINRSLDGWDFQLPSHKADALGRRWEDLLKVEEDPEEGESG